MPEREGLSRLDRYLPEVDVGVSLQHHLGHVVIAHRDAPGGDDHVGLSRPRERLPQHVRMVGDDAQVDRLNPGILEKREQHRPVGVPDRPRLETLCLGRGQLVTRRHECHPWALEHRGCPCSNSGENTDMHRGEPRPLGEHQLAL